MVFSELLDFLANRHVDLKYRAGGHKAKHRGTSGDAVTFRKQNDGVRNVVVGRDCV
jgi:hypothetical protein